MKKAHHRLWHTVREYATHWSIAGLIIAVTGVAPEHWLAETAHKVLPREGLPPWLGQVDFRLVAVLVGLTIIVGDNLWRSHRRAVPVPVDAVVPALEPKAATELPLPDKPSIAVLAFDNLSGNKEQEFFSDGMADDIITELSHDRSLFVIARNSSFTYKGRAVDVKQVARELGVRYVLEGSVRREADQVRVNAQMIDATTGNHIWAERFDRTVTDIFKVQDEITAAVTRAIHPALADAEQHRVMRKPPENLGAWEAYQRGLWHMGQHNAAEIKTAKEFFLRAVELDPMLSAAYVSLTIALISETGVYGTRLPDQHFYEQAGTWARKAIALDPDNPDAQAVLAWTELAAGRADEGWKRASRALAAPRQSYLASCIAGLISVYQGEPTRGRELLQEGIRINPRDPTNLIFVSLVAVAYYFDHNYLGAEKTARQAIADWPKSPLSYRCLTAALGQLGRVQEAQAALREAYAIPESLAFVTRGKPPWYRIEDWNHMLDGLRKAGWQG